LVTDTHSSMLPNPMPEGHSYSSICGATPNWGNYWGAAARLW